MTAIDARLIAKLEEPPLRRLANVGDFVDTLRVRDGQRLTRVAANAAEPAFAKSWDNDQDAACDRLLSSTAMTRRMTAMHCAFADLVLAPFQFAGQSIAARRPDLANARQRRGNANDDGADYVA